MCKGAFDATIALVIIFQIVSFSMLLRESIKDVIFLSGGGGGSGGASDGENLSLTDREWNEFVSSAMLMFGGSVRLVLATLRLTLWVWLLPLLEFLANSFRVCCGIFLQPLAMCRVIRVVWGK